jgi:hypothetical protein
MFNYMKVRYLHLHLRHIHPFIFDVNELIDKMQRQLNSWYMYASDLNSVIMSMAKQTNASPLSDSSAL